MRRRRGLHLTDEAAFRLWAQDMVRLRRTPAATRTVNECAGLPPLPAVRKTRDRLNDAPVRDGALMSYGPDQIEMFDPAADLLGKFTKEGADPANLLLET